MPPTVKCRPRAPPAHPLYCAGYVTRRGQSRILTPPRLDIPTIVCFESRQSAAETCRVVTFCTPDRRLIVNGEAYDTSDRVLTVVVTSHEDLAEAGWGAYRLDMCALEPDQRSLRIVASFACKGDAPLSKVTRRLEARFRGP